MNCTCAGDIWLASRGLLCSRETLNANMFIFTHMLNGVISAVLSQLEQYVDFISLPPRNKGNFNLNRKK